MYVGIDLGTTFSAIGTVKDGKAEIIVNREGERTTPSVVMFEDGAIVVGESAKENGVSSPEDVCQFVKRSMGQKDFKFQVSRNESYTAEEISAMILKRLKDDAEDAMGEDIKGAVITVPAYFDDSQRKATQDAGSIAGLDVIGIINEPTAAAIAYCYGNPDVPGNVMVFDLGGGTFDITIIKMDDDYSKITTVSTIGNRNLGGFDFDNLIINKVIDEYEKAYGMDLDDDSEATQDLRLKAEAAKKSLSNRAKAQINISANGKRLKVEITREEFEKMMRGHLQSMQGYMEDALDEAKLGWKDISKILLVGGSTRIPCVNDMIKRVSGIEPSHALNPDEAVALGASYYAQLIADRKGTGKEPKFEVIDVNSHSLGVIAANEVTGKLEASFIINKNTPLPAKKVNTYATMCDNQKRFNLQIVEGDDIDPDYDTIIQEITVNLPMVPAGTPIVVEMKYDTDGIIHTEAYLVHNYKEGFDEEEVFAFIFILGPKLAMLKYNQFVELLMEDMQVPRKSNLTKEQVERKRRNMDSMSID